MLNGTLGSPEHCGSTGSVRSACIASAQEMWDVCASKQSVKMLSEGRKNLNLVKSKKISKFHLVDFSNLLIKLNLEYVLCVSSGCTYFIKYSLNTFSVWGTVLRFVCYTEKENGSSSHQAGIYWAVIYFTEN